MCVCNAHAHRMRSNPNNVWNHTSSQWKRNNNKNLRRQITHARIRLEKDSRIAALLHSNSTRARQSARTLETRARTRDTDPVRTRVVLVDGRSRAPVCDNTYYARRRSECMLLGHTYCVSERSRRNATQRRRQTIRHFSG